MKAEITKDGVKELVRTHMRVVIQVAVLLVSAGRAGWVNAWIYFGLYMSVAVVYAVIMVRLSPQTLNERGRAFREDTKPFDKVFFALWLPLIFATLVIAGLDAVRFGWSAMPAWLNAAGVAVTIPGVAIGVWAPVANPHFEVTVRIQEDREHKVISSGPYRIVRHPGYAGVILATLAAPFLLGSWWAVIPCVLTAILFAVRTALEDKTLQEELPGYSEYAKRVRYRLYPGLW